MSEWKEYRLGDICTKIGSGATPSGGKEAYKGGNYALIRSQNILDHQFSKNGLAFIDDAQAKKLDGVSVEKDDILLNITGDSVARTCIVDSSILPARVNQHVAIIRTNQQISHSVYIHSWLVYKKPELLNLASFGATRNAITKKMIEDLRIQLPPLHAQKKIAAILSSLDAKIETNRKINARLEELAQALFKSWFIDFEPFGGKMPEDWEIKKMSDLIVDIAAGPFGSNLPKSSFTNTGIPIIDGANLKGRIVDETFTKFISKSKSEGLKRSVAHKGDFVVTISGTVGQIAYIAGTSHNSDYLVSQRQFRFKPNPKETNIYYLSLLFDNKIGKQKILSFANQVGVPALSQPLKNFKNIEIIVPNFEVQNRFGEIIESIDSKINKINKESSRLAALRDTLLPKLMSGELIPE